MIGAFLKVAIEGGFWTCIVGGGLAIPFLPFVPAIPSYELFNWQYWTLLGSFTFLFTKNEFCMFTLPASAVETSPKD